MLEQVLCADITRLGLSADGTKSSQTQLPVPKGQEKRKPEVPIFSSLKK